MLEGTEVKDFPVEERFLTHHIGVVKAEFDIIYNDETLATCEVEAKLHEWPS